MRVASCVGYGAMAALCLAVGAEASSAQDIVYDHPNARRVSVRSEVLSNADLTVDLYLPADRDDTDPPIVVMVLGYPDDALSVGPLKDFGYYRSWGRLLAAEGMVGVLYSTSEPEEDLYSVMQFLRDEAERLGVDRTRLALWSASANAALALKYARAPGAIEASALVAYSGLLPTPDGYQSAALDPMRVGSGFTLPEYGASEAYPADLPIYLVRAGRDRFPVLLRSIDHFVSYALQSNLRVDVRNYPEGRHTFDVENDTEETRAIIEETLRFLKRHLGLQGPGEFNPAD